MPRTTPLKFDTVEVPDTSYSRAANAARFCAVMVVLLIVLGMPVEQRTALAYSQSKPFSVTISGSKLLLNTSLDLCGIITSHFLLNRLPSCPFSLEVDEDYNQGLSGTATLPSTFLASGDSLSLEIQTLPDLPVAHVSMRTSVGNDVLPVVTYSVNYTTDGESSALTFNLPIKEIASDLSQMVPSAPDLTEYLSSLKLTLASSDKLSSRFGGGDFSGGQSIGWSQTGPQTVSVDFAGSDDSPILGMAIVSVQEWQVSLVAIIKNVSIPIKIPPANISFDSSNQNLFQWQKVLGISNYSSVQGSGWYLSGTAAKLSIRGTTVSLSRGVREKFLGWQTSSINGNLEASPSISLSATIPITETAEWVRQCTINIVSKDGIVSGANSGAWYDNGSQLTLTAKPKAGYVFKDWTQSGKVISTSQTLNYTVLSPSSVQAVYESNSSNPPSSVPGSGSALPFVAIFVFIASVIIALFYLRRKHILFD